MDHDLLQVGSPEAVTFLESFLANPFKGYIVALDPPVEKGGAWLRCFTAAPLSERNTNTRIVFAEICPM